MPVPRIDAPRDPPPQARLLAIAPSVVHCGCRWIGPEQRPPRSLPWWRLLWCDRPGASVDDPAGTHALEPGRLVLVPPGVAVHERFPVAAIHLYAWFSAGGGLDHRVAAVQRIALGDEGGALVARLAALWAARGPVTAGEQAAAIALIGLALAALPAAAWSGRASDPRVTAALDRLASHRGRPLANADLAAGVGLRTSRFLELFTATLGMSPQAWQLGQRLDRVALMLRAGDQPLRAIARACGFHDRSHLHRHFRRRFGLAPTAWRKQARGE